jgi:hypothetical protein
MLSFIKCFERVLIKTISDLFPDTLLIRHLWQLKTIIFLHWCLLRVVILITLIIGLTFKPRSDVTVFVKSTIAAVRGKCFDTGGLHYIIFFTYPMRLFHSVNSSVVSRNLWLILIMKVLLFLNFVKHTLKHF